MHALNHQGQFLYQLRSALPIGAVALAACDPAWHMAIRQPIAPVTTQQCILSVLQRSPEVDSVTTDRAGLLFALRDSTVPTGARQGWVTVERARDSTAVLNVSFTWLFPIAGVSATPEHTRYLAHVGQKLTDRIRTTCTPSVPAAASCRIEGPPLISKPPCGTEP